MDSGLYAAYTALLSRTNALDIAANNLANTSTVGFHAGRASFRGVLAEAQSYYPSQVGTAVNSQTLLQSSGVNEMQGAISYTGNPLDLALKGSGYFSIKTALGTRYTRDGEFQVAANGDLTTRQGDTVLDTQGKAIKVPTGEIKVGADGVISVATPDGSAIVGQIAIVDVGNGGLEPSETASMYKAADGATPKLSTQTQVEQGSIEGANQDAVQGTVQLLGIQRQAEMMQRALNVFHNDLDKTASEELARV